MIVLLEKSALSGAMHYGTTCNYIVIFHVNPKKQIYLEGEQGYIS